MAALMIRDARDKARRHLVLRGPGSIGFAARIIRNFSLYNIDKLPALPRQHMRAPPAWDA